MHAFATVTDPNFIIGTEVLLHSIIKFNPDFKGEFVIIHHELPMKYMTRLSANFKVKFHAASPELMHQLKVLGEELPNYSRIWKRFLSVEIFGMEQYDSVLYVDSDILCLGSLDRLWQMSGDLVACPDGTQNMVRDKSTFIKTSASKTTDPFFESGFNSGMMLVRQPILQRHTYKELLDKITPQFYQQVRTGHADQYLLNHFFESNVRLAPEKYNYIGGWRNKNANETDSAILLHYPRYPKPWQTRNLLKRRLKGEKMPMSWRLWHRAWRDYCRTYPGNNKLENQFLSRILAS
ncbi:MAG: hypothetical protein HRT71_06525 [Flavobacteriales bacterium]|nr:hypothetical protein [Flavobacteriales bacterium]